MTDLREDIAAYGARIGILEPLLIGCYRQIVPLREVQQQLRTEKRFDLADKIRAVIAQIQMNGEYALPARVLIKDDPK